MPEYLIAGIPVHFPFEPYDVQKAYMEKVITCLHDGTNAVLESPTGTGKTLSLLCSTLAWLLSRKADMQSLIQKNAKGGGVAQQAANEFSAMQARNASWGVPKIIYASRTHSQLTQAMQELKRTSYSFMRAVVLGSRDQLCIHPEVMREQGNANKVQLCKLRITTRTCTFYNRVESKKDCAELKESPVMDIEDLVRVGRKVKVCPYYVSKELTSDADITFMPYNYLLDPKARKANKVELSNTIVILDEAHNIEKICEESASVQIRSSDIALAIDDVTHVMKAMMNENTLDFMSSEEPKDFKLEDLVLLKEMLLDLEKGIDDIVVEDKAEGATFPPSFLFELLAAAKITPSIAAATINLLEKLITFLAVESQDKSFRKGGSFEIFANLLNVVFIKKDDVMAKIHKSFKVHVQIEEIKQQNKNKDKDGWLSKAPSNNSKLPKIINYWCFNPGFGMEQLLNSQVRSIILTSGTLAPLKPLIAELAVPIAQSLENPHIVGQSQVFVKIIGTGPDREQLISNFANRDNPKYLSSLGQTVLNVSRIVPDGLLVFFPSYPLLNQCVNTWQASGLWAEVCRHKPVFVEPRGKESFTTTMEEFYKSISDGKGACFLAVCRGKVSEGLDFADRNGRAVIITGLPFPPLKDPKVILKKRYLEDNRTKENELLTGQAWYSLEATRAVNQAIGRVIRHKHDYGAILLCDVRFAQSNQATQLSKWVREYLGAYPKSVPFGSIVRELREFFRNADNTLPKPKERSIEALVTETCEEAGIVNSSRYFSDPKLVLEAKNKFASAQSMAIKIEKTNSIEGWTPDDYKTAAGRSQGSHVPSAMDFMSRLDNNVKAIDFNSASCSGTSCSGQVSIYKRERMSPSASPSCSNTNFSAISNKKKRYKLVTDTSSQNPPSPVKTQPLLNDFSFKSKAKLSISTSVAVQKEAPQERVEFLKILRNSLSSDDFSDFTAALMAYSRQDMFEEFMKVLLRTMAKPELHYMLRGMRRFIKSAHKELFDGATAHILS